jgi:hypothetical protein
VVAVVAVVAGQIIETHSLPTLTRSYPSSLYLLCR